MNNILGEIRAFGGDFAPKNWMLCDGTKLNIADYTPLYTLIGTTYGGDGIRNFALPNLCGMLALGQGQGPGLTMREIGSNGGEEKVALSAATMPAHNHQVMVSTVTTGSINGPSETAFLGSVQTTASGTAVGFLPNVPGITQKALDESTVQPNIGPAEPHNNIMPCTAINYIICVVGIYPSFP